jgi:eIF-2B alpha/beta/delta-like uncharacterized protein
MQSKQVVTSFLQFQSKILILKRSEKVGTHRSKWAGVSGYLEKKEEPVSRAIREIGEETGLTENDVILQNSSIPLGVSDPENDDTLWVIYPFLFRVKSNDIMTDWEHTDFRWIEPLELQNYDTVPMLNEVLHSVLELPIEKVITEPKIIDRLLNIQRDNSHGASWLAREAIDTLIEASKLDKSKNLSNYLNKLKLLSLKLMFIRPSLAPIHSQIGELMKKITLDSRSNKNLEKLKSSIENEGNRMKMKSLTASERIAENVLKIIPEKASILTHSYSDTIIKSLKMMKDEGKEIHVFVTESRPLLEGRKTAQELLKHGIKTTVITDAASGIFAGQVSLILLGADSLLADGSLINKTGSYPIALAATYQGIPVYVAAELNKINLRSYFTRIKLEEKDKSEVWSKSPKSLTIRNIYFDITPQFFIHKIITESQSIRSDNILHICEDLIKELYII